MTQPTLESAELKRIFKESLAETLNEQRDLLREVFTEVLEDSCLLSAIQEGRQSERIARDEVFEILAGHR